VIWDWIKNQSRLLKIILLLIVIGYSQNCRNPGVKTIEEDLTNALYKARAISEDASRNYGKVCQVTLFTRMQIISHMEKIGIYKIMN
jgi:hypothetical protein